MSKENDFKFEQFEEYYGDIGQVKKLLYECKSCGGKLMQTHLSDYSNLYVQENSSCPDCGEDERKVIHVLN